jgi:hypothetical protein
MKYSLINFVNETKYYDLITSLASENYEVLNIESSLQQNYLALYNQLITVLPNDPPLPTDRIHWDAFQDSTWEGLSNSKISKYALVWRGVDKFVQDNLGGFVNIIDNLLCLSRSVYSIKTGLEKPITFLIFLIGSDKRF